MKTIVFAGGLALLGTLLGTRLAILVLVKKGYGQLIRDDGPTSHHVKRGTPTMGGLVIIAAVLLAYFGSHLITFTPPSASALLVLFLFTGPGCGRVSRRLHQDQQTALARFAEQGEDRRPIDRGHLVRGRITAVPRRAGNYPGLACHLVPARHRMAPIATDPGDHLGHAADRGRQQRRQPHRRARRPRLRCLRHDLRRLHAGQHLAVQPVLRLHRLRRAKVLRGAGPVRPGGGGGRAGRRLLRLPVVERRTGEDLHGRHRLAVPGRRARRQWRSSPAPSCCW